MSDWKPSRKPVIRVRNSDGSWRELSSDRSPSDDPEINQLWDLPVSDLELILDDPDHPLYEKAVAVTAQAFAPLQAAVQELLESSGSPLLDLEDSLRPLLPNINTSWISDLVSEYPVWQKFRRSLPEPARTDPFVIDSIDFDSVTPPDVSLRKVASAADDAAVVVLEELLVVQREQLAQARADAKANKDALDVARGSRTAGWWAAGAAILAAVIGIVGIVVTVVNAPG